MCYCPIVKNEDELIKKVKDGKYDMSIYKYLIEIMSEYEGKVLSYKPEELFELQVELSDENELLHINFSDIRECGVYENNRYKLNKKQNEMIEIFISRINEIYESLKNLVLKESK